MMIYLHSLIASAFGIHAVFGYRFNIGSSTDIRAESPLGWAGDLQKGGAHLLGVRVQRLEVGAHLGGVLAQVLEIGVQILKLPVHLLEMAAHHRKLPAHFLEMAAHLVKIPAHPLKLEVYPVRLPADSGGVGAPFLKLPPPWFILCRWPAERRAC